MKQQNAKPRNAKAKIEIKPESIIQIKLPMVRNFSTGGGHLPSDETRRGRREDRDEEVAGLCSNESQCGWKADAADAADARGGYTGAISNAIYNACGVRIREHPITREKIIAGLKAQPRNA